MECMFCEERLADKECYFCHSLMCGECGEVCTDCGIDICYGCMRMENGSAYCDDCPSEGWIDEDELIAEVCADTEYWDDDIPFEEEDEGGPV